MLRRTSRKPDLTVGRPPHSGPTTLDVRTVDGRHIPTDALIAELADLEERIRLLDPQDDLGQPLLLRQTLVAAEYEILRELRRRRMRPRLGIRWTTLRPRRVRTR